MGTSGGPGKIDSLNYGDQMERMAETNARRGGRLYRTAMPLYEEMVGQTLEGLRTGGIGAQIPTIQRAVEQSKIATSNALSQTGDRLRGAGLANSPFGQNILGGIQSQGAQRSAAIPTEIVQAFIAGAPGLSGQGFGAGQAYSGLGANTLGNLQSLDLQRQMANAQQFQAFMDAIREYAQSTQSMAAMCLHPSTPIEVADHVDRPLRDLAIGDIVLSRDHLGNKVGARVVGLIACDVPRSHRLAVVGAPRGNFLATPSHPLPDGTPIVPFPGTVETIAGTTMQTMDLLVDSPTGIYFVLGMALGSTLDARHCARRVA